MWFISMCNSYIGIGVLLVALDALSSIAACFLSGCLMAAWTAAILLLGRSSHVKSDLLSTPTLGTNDEDEYADDFPLLSPETLSYILANCDLAHVAFRAVLSGVTWGSFVIVMALDQQQKYFNTNDAWAVFSLNFIAVALAQSMLTSSYLPEPAVYDALSSSFVSESRCIQLCIFYLAIGLCGTRDYYDQASFYIRIVSCSLIVIWQLGWLGVPPALMAWAIDQYNVVLMGGTASRCDVTAIKQALLSTLAALVVWAFIQAEVKYVTVVAIASAFGFLLAIDWQTIVPFSAWKRVNACVMCKLQIFPENEGISGRRSLPSSSTV